MFLEKIVISIALIEWIGLGKRGSVQRNNQTANGRLIQSLPRVSLPDGVQMKNEIERPKRGWTGHPLEEFHKLQYKWRRRLESSGSSSFPETRTPTLTLTLTLGGKTFRSNQNHRPLTMNVRGSLRVALWVALIHLPTRRRMKIGQKDADS